MTRSVAKVSDQGITRFSIRPARISSIEASIWYSKPFALCGRSNTCSSPSTGFNVAVVAPQ